MKRLSPEIIAVAAGAAFGLALIVAFASAPRSVIKSPWALVQPPAEAPADGIAAAR